MDIFNKTERSYIMAKVKQKSTEPEIIIRKFLFSEGFRYRVNVRSLPGSPDIVLPKYRTLIFVHGCFWHGHTCRAGHLPSSNLSYWQPKIEKNIERDQKKIDDLKKQGWNVIVVWQCEIKTVEKRKIRFSTLISQIKNCMIN